MAGPDLAARGTAVRSRRAALKRAIRTGDVDVADLFAGDVDQDLEQVALEMTLEQLLEAQHGWGPGRTEELLEAALEQPAPGKRLGNMPTAARRKVAEALRNADR